MTDTLPPPAPASDLADSTPPPGPPPAGLGPAGCPMWPAPAPQTPPTSHAAATVNIIAGASLFLSVFLPAFAVTDVYGNAMWYSMTQIPDAPFFMIVGLLIAALGAVRLRKDDTGVCVLVTLAGVAAVIFAVTDANLSHLAFLSSVGSSGYGYTFGAALFMIGASGVVAAVSCFMPKADDAS